jgi:hypothetical protein
MKKYLVAAFIAVMGVISVSPTPTAHAIDLFGKCSTANKEGCAVVKENNLNYQGKNSVWTIIQFVLGILGAISVLMIVIGGIKFATSAGDSAGVSSAKNTILYAVIGLVVAMLASGIVLVVTNFFV